MQQQKTRLKKLQAVNPNYADMLVLDGIVKEGRFYDELTDEEKEAVVRAWKTNRDTYETIHGFFFNGGSLHFQPSKPLPPPKTKAEMEERLKVIDEAFRESEREYNSPEARAKREAEERELNRIAELRRNAAMTGRSMDEFPYPWEEQESEERKRWEAWTHRNDKA